MVHAHTNIHMPSDPHPKIRFNRPRSIDWVISGIGNWKKNSLNLPISNTLRKDLRKALANVSIEDLHRLRFVPKQILRAGEELRACDFVLVPREQSRSFHSVYKQGDVEQYETLHRMCAEMQEFDRVQQTPQQGL